MLKMSEVSSLLLGGYPTAFSSSHHESDLKTRRAGKVPTRDKSKSMPLGIVDSNRLSDDAADKRRRMRHVHLRSGSENEDVIMPQSGSERVTPPMGTSTSVLKTAVTPLSAAVDWALVKQRLGEKTTDADFARQLAAEELSHGGHLFFNAEATHLCNRLPLIDWICMTGIEMRLQRETIYRGIRHFDKLCSSNDISKAHLQPCAAVCLLIATKWSEREEKVPLLRELSECCGRNANCSPSHLKVIEIRVLTLLDFQLKTVLPIDFAQRLLAAGVVFHGDKLDGIHINLHPQSETYMRKFMIFFLDIVSQEYWFWKELPSLVAATVIAASRKALRIDPFWNESLTQKAGYSLTEMKPCLDHLWEVYATKFPADASRAEIRQKLKIPPPKEARRHRRAEERTLSEDSDDTFDCVQMATINLEQVSASDVLMDLSKKRIAQTKAMRFVNDDSDVDDASGIGHPLYVS